MDDKSLRTASNAEAVLSFLRDRGILTGDDVSPQQIVENKQQQAYHNTLLLLTNYSPSPSSETPIGAEPAPLGADASGFIDYGGVGMPGQNTPPGNPVTMVDTPLTDTEAPGSYDFNAGEPGTHV